MATVAAVAVLLLDTYAVRPLLDRHRRLADERQRLLAELGRAEALIARGALQSVKWDAMRASGMKTQRIDSESQVLHALRDWSRESGLDLVSLKPIEVEERGRLREISFQAAATGRMRAVATFLWKIENASIPLRVSQLQLGSRQEGADDLSLQLRLSTVFAPAADAAAGSPVDTEVEP